MFLKSSRSASPIMLFSIVLLLAVLFLPSFINGPRFLGQGVEGDLFMPLKVFENNAFLSPFFAAVFTLVIALLTLRLTNQYILISRRTYLTAFLFVAISGSFAEIKWLNPVYVAALFLIMAVDRFIDSYRKEGEAMGFFEGSMLIGISGMCYVPALAYIITAWAALILFRPFRWREWVFTFIGLLLPYFFLASYYFFAEKDFLKFLKPFLASINQEADKQLHLSQVLYIGLIAMILIVASVFANRKLQGQKIQAGKSYFLFFYMFLISILLYAVLPGVGIEIFIIAAIPVSFLLAQFYAEAKQTWLLDLSFDAILLGSIAIAFLIQ
jgi:hypothetical protein